MNIFIICILIWQLSKGQNVLKKFLSTVTLTWAPKNCLQLANRVMAGHWVLNSYTYLSSKKLFHMTGRHMGRRQDTEYWIAWNCTISVYMYNIMDNVCILARTNCSQNHLYGVLMYGFLPFHSPFEYCKRANIRGGFNFAIIAVDDFSAKLKPSR